MKYYWVLFNTALWTVVFGLPGIFLTFFESNKGKILGKYIIPYWAKFILFFTRIRYEVEGLKNLNSNSNYIFAGNHSSSFDIPIAFAGLPYWLVPIAKIELKSVFILGWVMDTAGHIWVDRQKRENTLETLQNIKTSLINKPRSILLFPEGTRTLDGSLGKFKKGGLLLSKDINLSIVPIAFIGTFNLLSKGSHVINNETIKLKIGEPISPHEYSELELANYVKEKVQELL